ncbi:MAG: PorP/SprF family type IX secretion system membrane protein [Bacteroidota bacterium]
MIAIWGSPWLACAQYFHYSQYNFTDLRVNPAMAGLTRYASASANYRHQKTGGDFAINSNFLAMDYPLLNNSTGRPWAGIGLALHNDQSAGIFRMQEAALTYALHVRLSRWQTLSLGVKGLYQQRTIGLDGFYTGSQYVPDRGFDPSHFSGEDFATLRNRFWTISSGIYWHETDRRGKLLHYFGFSLFDFNKPDASFLDGTENLSSTFIFNGGWALYQQNYFSVIPEVLMSYSAAIFTTNAGVRLQKELNGTVRHQGDKVDLLLKYAVGRSGIAGIQWHKENFSVGLSYDFPLQANPGNLGAVEVALAIRKLVPTRAQKISAKRRKAAEERQQALQSKKVLPKPVTADSVVAASTPADSLQNATPAVEVEKMQPVEQNPEAMAQAGKLKQEPLIIEKVTLHFAFEFNSSDLDEATEEFLKELTVTLKENNYLKVKIEGHTDNIGSDKFNQRLSLKRAEAVKHLLLKKGIEAERLTTEGKGLHHPLNDNLTEEDRAKNRRVEITLYYGG